MKEKYDLLDTLTIQKLNGVWVHTENIPIALGKKGLKKEQIEREIALKLNNAGVKTISETDYETTAGASCLTIRENSASITYSGLAGLTNFAILVSFMQYVYPQTSVSVDGSITRIDKTTWEKTANGSTLHVPSIKDNILNIVDLFLRDCLAVNAIEKGNE